MIDQIKLDLYNLATRANDAQNPQDQKKARLLIHEFKQTYRTTIKDLYSSTVSDFKILKLSHKLIEIQHNDYHLKNKPTLIRKWIRALSTWRKRRTSTDQLIAFILKAPKPEVSSPSQPLRKLFSPSSEEKTTGREPESPFKPRKPNTPGSSHTHPIVLGDEETTPDKVKNIKKESPDVPSTDSDEEIGQKPTGDDVLPTQSPLMTKDPEEISEETSNSTDSANPSPQTQTTTIPSLLISEADNGGVETSTRPRSKSDPSPTKSPQPRWRKYTDLARGRPTEFNKKIVVD